MVQRRLQSVTLFLVGSLLLVAAVGVGACTVEVAPCNPSSVGISTRNTATTVIADCVTNAVTLDTALGSCGVLLRNVTSTLVTVNKGVAEGFDINITDSSVGQLAFDGTNVTRTTVRFARTSVTGGALGATDRSAVRLGNGNFTNFSLHFLESDVNVTSATASAYLVALDTPATIDGFDLMLHGTSLTLSGGVAAHAVRFFRGAWDNVAVALHACTVTVRAAQLQGSLLNLEGILGDNATKTAVSLTTRDSVLSVTANLSAYGVFTRDAQEPLLDVHVDMAGGRFDLTGAYNPARAVLLVSANTVNASFESMSYNVTTSFFSVGGRNAPALLHDSGSGTVSVVVRNVTACVAAPRWAVLVWLDRTGSYGGRSSAVIDNTTASLSADFLAELVHLSASMSDEGATVAVMGTVVDAAIAMCDPDTSRDGRLSLVSVLGLAAANTSVTVADTIATLRAAAFCFTVFPAAVILGVANASDVEVVVHGTVLALDVPMSAALVAVVACALHHAAVDVTNSTMERVSAVAPNDQVRYAVVGVAHASFAEVNVTVSHTVARVPASAVVLVVNTTVASSDVVLQHVTLDPFAVPGSGALLRSGFVSTQQGVTFDRCNLTATYLVVVPPRNHTEFRATALVDLSETAIMGSVVALGNTTGDSFSLFNGTDNSTVVQSAITWSSVNCSALPASSATSACTINLPVVNDTRVSVEGSWLAAATTLIAADITRGVQFDLTALRIVLHSDSPDGVAVLQLAASNAVVKFFSVDVNVTARAGGQASVVWGPDVQESFSSRFEASSFVVDAPAGTACVAYVAQRVTSAPTLASFVSLVLLQSTVTIARTPLALVFNAADLVSSSPSFAFRPVVSDSRVHIADASEAAVVRVARSLVRFRVLISDSALDLAAPTACAVQLFDARASALPVSRVRVRSANVTLASTDTATVIALRNWTAPVVMRVASSDVSVSAAARAVVAASTLTSGDVSAPPALQLDLDNATVVLRSPTGRAWVAATEASVPIAPITLYGCRVTLSGGYTSAVAQMLFSNITAAQGSVTIAESTVHLRLATACTGLVAAHSCNSSSAWHVAVNNSVILPVTAAKTPSMLVVFSRCAVASVAVAVVGSRVDVFQPLAPVCAVARLSSTSTVGGASVTVTNSTLTFNCVYATVIDVILGSDVAGALSLDVADATAIDFGGLAVNASLLAQLLAIRNATAGTLTFRASSTASIHLAATRTSAVSLYVVTVGAVDLGMSATLAMHGDGGDARAIEAINVITSNATVVLDGELQLRGVRCHGMRFVANGALHLRLTGAVTAHCTDDVTLIGIAAPHVLTAQPLSASDVSIALNAIDVNATLVAGVHVSGLVVADSVIAVALPVVATISARVLRWAALVHCAANNTVVSVVNGTLHAAAGGGSRGVFTYNTTLTDCDVVLAAVAFAAGPTALFPSYGVLLQASELRSGTIQMEGVDVRSDPLLHMQALAVTDCALVGTVALVQRVAFHGDCAACYLVRVSGSALERGGLRVRNVVGRINATAAAVLVWFVHTAVNATLVDLADWNVDVAVTGGAELSNGALQLSGTGSALETLLRLTRVQWRYVNDTDPPGRAMQRVLVSVNVPLVASTVIVQDCGLAAPLRRGVVSFTSLQSTKLQLLTSHFTNAPLQLGTVAASGSAVTIVKTVFATVGNVRQELRVGTCSGAWPLVVLGCSFNNTAVALCAMQNLSSPWAPPLARVADNTIRSDASSGVGDVALSISAFGGAGVRISIAGNTIALEELVAGRRLIAIGGAHSWMDADSVIVVYDNDLQQPVAGVFSFVHITLDRLSGSAVAVLRNTAVARIAVAEPTGARFAVIATRSVLTNSTIDVATAVLHSANASATLLKLSSDADLHAADVVVRVLNSTVVVDTAAAHVDGPELLGVHRANFSAAANVQFAVASNAIIGPINASAPARIFEPSGANRPPLSSGVTVFTRCNTANGLELSVPRDHLYANRTVAARCGTCDLPTDCAHPGGVVPSGRGACYCRCPFTVGGNATYSDFVVPLPVQCDESQRPFWQQGPLPRPWTATRSRTASKVPSQTTTGSPVSASATHTATHTVRERRTSSRTARERLSATPTRTALASNATPTMPAAASSPTSSIPWRPRATRTASASLHSEPEPVVRPLPAAVVEAARAVATTSAAASGVASPGSALQVARTLDALALVDFCTLPDAQRAHTLTQSLGFPRSAVPPARFGPATGQHHRAAILVNIAAVPAVFVIAALAGAAFCLALPRSQPRSVRDAPELAPPVPLLLRGVRATRMPGMLAAVYGLFVSGSASSAVVLAATTAWGAADVVLCVVGVATVVVPPLVWIGITERLAAPGRVLVPALCTVVRSRSGESLLPPLDPRTGRRTLRERLLRFLLLGEAYWFPVSPPNPRDDEAQAMFVAQSAQLEYHGILFARYRALDVAAATKALATGSAALGEKNSYSRGFSNALVRHYFVIEVATAVLASIAQGLATVSCRAAAWMSLWVNIVALLLSVVLRPYNVPVKNVLAVVINAITFVSSTVAVAALEAGGTDGAWSSALGTQSARLAAGAAFFAAVSLVSTFSRIVWLRLRHGRLEASTAPEAAAMPLESLELPMLSPPRMEEPLAQPPPPQPRATAPALAAAAVVASSEVDDEALDHLLDDEDDDDDDDDGANPSGSVARPQSAMSAAESSGVDNRWSFVSDTPRRVYRTLQGQQLYEELERALSVHAGPQADPSPPDPMTPLPTPAMLLPPSGTPGGHAAAPPPQPQRGTPGTTATDFDALLDDLIGT